MKRRLFCVMVSVIALSFAGQTYAKELNVAGSTTVQKGILEPAGEAVKAATGIDVKVRGINSGKGFSELMEGRIEASISSSPLKGLLEKAGVPDDGTYREHIITEDVIVPIVHISNAVDRLTWEQLAAINTGKITNWKEVGGPDQKIIVVTSQPTAATRTVFQEIVMKKGPYAEGIREVMSTRQEIDLVAKFRGGLGAVSESFVAMNPGKVKVITTERISRPLSFITKGTPTPDVQSVIDYLKTPDARKLYK